MRAALTNAGVVTYIGQSAGQSKGRAEMAADVEQPQGKLAYLMPSMRNPAQPRFGHVWLPN